MNSNYHSLIEQIDAFVRKYYKYQLVRGILVFSSFFIGVFLLTSSIEFFGRFSTFVRSLFFFGFILFHGYLFYDQIFKPLSKLFSLGKKIDHLQAAEIIGQFFPEVADKLKNTLQLHQNLTEQIGNLELLQASIQQRSEKLSLISFQSALHYQDHRKYLKYLLPVLFLFLTVGLFLPQLIVQGTKRVVFYNQVFEKPNPYIFEFLNNSKSIEEGQDYLVDVRVKPNKGFNELPNQLYLVSSQGKFLMKKHKKNRFYARMTKLQQSAIYHVTTNEFNSQKQIIRVTRKSVIGLLNAVCTFPKYLNKAPQVIQNVGDLNLPEGTQIQWQVRAKNTQSILVSWNGQIQKFNSQVCSFDKKLTSDVRVSFVLTNQQTYQKDTTSSKITVIKDAYPIIEVSEEQDSVYEGRKYFKGSLRDDYGLNNLFFVYTIESANGQKRTEKMRVQNVKGTAQNFDFAVDFKREKIQLEDVIKYYFIVSDNDGVNGSKSTRSQVNTYELPNLEQLNEQRQEEQAQQIDALQDILKKSQDFQKDVQQLKKEALQNKNTNWNKLNKVQELKQQQEQLQQQLKETLQQMEQSTEQKNQLSPLDLELLEKQDLLEKLLQEVMDDELKKLLDELEKLLEQQNKEETRDKLEELNQSSEDMKKQLDRSLEMLKKMQVNERIDDLEKQLEALSKEQTELEQNKDELTKEELLQKQKELNDKFEGVKQDLKELNELNKALERPLDLEVMDDLQQQVEQDLKEATEEISEGKNKKASENQKQAAAGMQSMAAQLNAKQQQSNKKQQEEDMESLRAILEGLLTLSFDQEYVQNRFTKVSTKDPIYRKLGRRQQRIIDDTKIIKDSLIALAKRQPKIATFIDAELNAIAHHQSLTIEAIDDHQKKEIEKHQQLAMTSYNNLALLLNEALQSMQQEMSGEMDGSGSCDNPGKGRPKSGQSMNPGDMKEMLKKQLEQMQKGAQPGGKQPGQQPGSTPGKDGKPGQGLMGLGSKELAKMAAEQTAIRQRLEQLRQELNKEGKGLGNQLNPLIKELEEQEKDLLLKRIDQQTIQRQKEIMTRLLESEKAMMQRGFEEKRESQSGKDTQKGNQIRFDEYKRSKWNDLELLRGFDPALQPYYKQRADQYLQL
ncbi:MAG: hypothetical protein ACKOWX_06065 [Flavobacteriales bacterium]